MTTRLGIRCGSWDYINGYSHLYDRRSTPDPVQAYEAYVRATGGPELADYTVGAARSGYLSFAQSWPPSNVQLDGSWANYAANDTLNVFSFGGNETPTATQIQARGNDLIAWFNSHPTMESMVGTYWHEPNNNVTPDVWWQRMENIVTTWTAMGVPYWRGTQAGVTTQRGMIYAGPNLASLTATNTLLGVALFNLWYPVSNTWAWSANGIQMASFDIYPGSTSGNGRWRGLPELWGDPSAQPTPGTTSEFIEWYIGRRAAQNNLGRTLLAGCFEWGWDDWNKIWPGSSTRYFDDQGSNAESPTQWWMDHVGTYPPTFTQGLQNFAAYLTANPTLFYVICYWDSIASGTAPGSGRGPHMLDCGAPSIYQQAASPGTQQTNWNGWLNFVKTPVFGHVGGVIEPPPPVGFVPGVVAPMTRVKSGG